MSMNNDKRIVFLDYLRVVACLMVMFVHACELFYFGSEGEFHIATAGDAFWVTLVDSACRASVPLFVMASSYLLFPLTRPTKDFFRRRLMRVVVPFALWCAAYVWRFDGRWVDCLFNFPMATGGHLWFVPMLLGIYLFMPLLSPWAHQATEREVRGWLLVWLGTTLFPYLRHVCAWICGAPKFGAVPYLYGECPWNSFGMFQYVSGFFGYMLLGFYFRRFVPALSWRRTLAWALPLWGVGYAVAAYFFYSRIPGGGVFPVTRPYAAAVDMEMSWEFCSTGVALTVAAYFLVLRKCVAEGAFYRWVIRPLAEASYGTYLLHIMVLVVAAEYMKGRVATPIAILGIAVVTFIVSASLSWGVRKVPKVGKWVMG